MASQNVQEILKLHFSVLSQVCVCVCVCVCARAHVVSHIQLFMTPWTVAHQAPLSMGLSGQEYCSGLPFPSLGDLPNPRNQTCFSCISCIGGRFFTICTIYEGTSSHTVQPLMISPYPRWQPCNTTVTSILLK